MRISIALASTCMVGCLLAAVCLAGCYTRLTTPKEAINFLEPEGKPIETFAILAPMYNELLRQKEAEGIPTASMYRLVPGTRVRVEVWGHGISSALNIRPDGIIDLPLIGDVKAEGRTVPELKAEIAERYKEFYVQPPQVILNTEATDEQESVLGGDVTVLQAQGGQGVVNLTGDEYLSQVLAEVGALNAFTEWNEIAVIRKGRATKESYIIVCNIERLVRKADFEQDILMRNGDIVFVPREKNTILQEILASVGVLADFVEDVGSVTDYVERVEGY